MTPIEFNAYGTDVEIGENGSVSGYAIKWGVVDGKKDIHHKGAYARTIEHNDGDFIFLPNHDKNDPIGRVTKVVEDDNGLYFEANFADTDTAQKYRDLLMQSVIRKFSMGWVPIRWDRNEHGGRNVYEAKLMEISPVAIPVGEATEVLEVNNYTATPEQVYDRFGMLAKNIGDKKKRRQSEAEILKLAEYYKLATHPTEVTDSAKEVVETNENNDFLTELNEALQNK